LSPLNSRNNVLVIGGPTASGKSGLALAAAEALGGVVINADSMQMYRGLPLLTAQPPGDDIARAPHRLYAGLRPDDVCSAARWRNLALDEIASAHAAGKVPILAGGTGFYIKTLIKGISPIPEVSQTVREGLIRKQREMGNPAFHAAFSALDPAMAAKLDPCNTQRVIRAWEVLEGTGKSLAEWQKTPPVAPPAHLRFIVTILTPPREALYAACDARFDAMIGQGALAEVARFRDEWPGEVPLKGALGFAPLAVHLEGQISLEEAVKKGRQETRNYAKRQMTWFRHQIFADIILKSNDKKDFFSALKSFDIL